MKKPYEFGIRQKDGSWAQCDDELNQWLNRIAAAFGGQPLTCIAYDEEGEGHAIAGQSYHVLHLALLAMDARLRPSRDYKKRADDIYAALAGGTKGGIQELRRVFRLGRPGPYPLDEGEV